MNPPEKGFKADHLAATAHERLEIESELAPAQSGRKVTRDLMDLGFVTRHLGREHNTSVTAVRFCEVHSPIGAFLQNAERSAVVGEKADAHTGAQKQLVFIDRERRR